MATDRSNGSLDSPRGNNNKSPRGFEQNSPYATQQKSNKRIFGDRKRSTGMPAKVDKLLGQMEDDQIKLRQTITKQPS